MPCQEPLVGGLILLGHDLDPVEQGHKAGAGDLALLVEQVALRDQPQFVITRAQGLQHFTRSLDQLDRVLDHRPTERHDGLDVLGWNVLIRNLDGRLNHGEHKAFDAVAIGDEVASLSLE